MTDNGTVPGGATRREHIGYGGTIAGDSLLDDCTDDGGRNGHVAYVELTYQRLILHLFRFEQAAHGACPYEFEEGRLFDRQRVADIVAEGFDR